jgi:hypothetical protein
VRADALAHGSTGSKRPRGRGVGFAHIAQRKPADGGKSGRGEAGAAQECAAVETAGLTYNSGGE